MPKFCGSIQEKAKQEQYKNKELEGEMVECLKTKFSTKVGFGRKNWKDGCLWEGKGWGQEECCHRAVMIAF